MLDYVCIFTKGGTLLWALSFVGALKGEPVNALVRACDVHDVPCATNLSTARLMLAQWQSSVGRPARA